MLCFKTSLISIECPKIQSLPQTSIPLMRLKRNSVSKIPGYFISLKSIISPGHLTVEKPIGAKSILMTTLQRKLPILKSRNGTASLIIQAKTLLISYMMAMYMHYLFQKI